MFSNPPPENRVVYESKNKNTVQLDRPKMVKWRMCIACWIRKAAFTQSECVIFTAFPLQQCLHRKRLLVTLYTHCLSRCISYNTRNENLRVCVQLDKPLCG